MALPNGPHRSQPQSPRLPSFPPKSRLSVPQTECNFLFFIYFFANSSSVNEVLLSHNLLRVLSQVPVILFPANCGRQGGRCIALRPFVTHDFMTGVPALPRRHLPEAAYVCLTLPLRYVIPHLFRLDEIVTRIMAEMPEIVRVCYDLTAKPPGTVCLRRAPLFLWNETGRRRNGNNSVIQTKKLRGCLPSSRFGSRFFRVEYSLSSALRRILCSVVKSCSWFPVLTGFNQVCSNITHQIRPF